MCKNKVIKLMRLQSVYERYKNHFVKSLNVLQQINLK